MADSTAAPAEDTGEEGAHADEDKYAVGADGRGPEEARQRAESSADHGADEEGWCEHAAWDSGREAGGGGKHLH